MKTANLRDKLNLVSSNTEYKSRASGVRAPSHKVIGVPTEDYELDPDNLHEAKGAIGVPIIAGLIIAIVALGWVLFT